MSDAKARVVAWSIYKGRKKIGDVAKADQPTVREQYALLFGVELA